MRSAARYARALGYARVSSPDQAIGTSLENQQDTIKAGAKARGITVSRSETFRIFVEAETAIYEKIERRDQIRLLLAEVRAGDLVLCDKLDRWSRDPEFTYRSIREILEKGASFYAIGDQCDPSTKEGDTMLGFRVLVAREEHKRIKERMVGTRKILRDRGYYAEGLPPFGYERSLKRGEKGLAKNVLRVIENAAALVREIFRRCIQGESVNQLVASFKRDKRAVALRLACDHKCIWTMLRNRVYLGEVLDTRGVWIKAQHAAIITPAVFAKAQAALASRRLGGARAKETSHTRTWLARELARCAKCGARMSSAYGCREGSTVYTYYYRCSKRCGVRYVPVLAADEAIAAMVLERLAELREHLSAGEEPPRRVKTIDFGEEKARLQRKRERFLDLFAEGEMSRDELRASLAKVDEKRVSVESREAEQSKVSPLSTRDVRRQTLAHVGEIQKSWKKAGIEDRRALLRELATAVHVARDTPPAVEWRSAGEIAADLRV